MSRERLLPDEMTLQKIARYEAHLSRGLYQAMHELEALQTKRRGRSFGPYRRAGPRKLKLPNEPPLADSPLEPD
jgi:hypothetical protein